MSDRLFDALYNALPAATRCEIAIRMSDTLDEDISISKVSQLIQKLRNDTTASWTIPPVGSGPPKYLNQERFICVRRDAKGAKFSQLQLDTFDEQLACCLKGIATMSRNNQKALQYAIQYMNTPGDKYISGELAIKLGEVAGSLDRMVNNVFDIHVKSKKA